MSDEENKLQIEFENKKAEISKMFPDYEAKFKLCSNFGELYEVFKEAKAQIDYSGEDDDEKGTETDKEGSKRKMTVEHIHSWAEKEKEDDSPATIYKSGQDLSKTGGKSLAPPNKRKGIDFDPTSRGKSGKQIIGRILDEIDYLQFKQSYGSLNNEERARYKVLRAKEEELMNSLRIGHLARGKRVKSGSFWRCGQCGSDVINSDMCQTCQYVFGQKIDQDKKRKWTILRGK